MSGRPFRFLAAATGGWVAVRLALLWPTIETLPDLLRAVAPAAAAEPVAFFADAPPPPRRAAPPRRATIQRMPQPPAGPGPPLPAPPLPEPPRILPVEPAPPRLAGIGGDGGAGRGRWAVSLWGIARQGLASPRFGSQLGGSQAGVRATYRLGRGLAVAARASGALDGTGKELALGLDWQPLAAPVHLIAEQRVPVGGGTGGAALFVVAGLDPRPLAAGFRLEAYAQAGAVLRGGAEPFADGAARLMRTVTATRAARVELGAGLWAGAQRGAARVDLGPSAALVVPIGGGDHAIRLALDWRQRIAGNARPGSGPALSIGADL